MYCLPHMRTWYFLDASSSRRRWDRWKRRLRNKEVDVSMVIMLEDGYYSLPPRPVPGNPVLAIRRDGIPRIHLCLKERTVRRVRTEISSASARGMVHAILPKSRKLTWWTGARHSRMGHRRRDPTKSPSRFAPLRNLRMMGVMIQYASANLKLQKHFWGLYYRTRIT